MRWCWIALVLAFGCDDSRPNTFGNLRWRVAVPVSAPKEPVMAIDGDDDLVVGTTAADGASIRIAKYAGTDGSLLWQQVFAGVEVAMPHVGVDGNADIVVTGSFKGSATFGKTSLASDTQVPFVAKLTSAGEVAWATAFSGNSFACGGAVSTDTDDNVYAAGDCEGTLDVQGHSIACTGAFVAAFDATGAARWNQTTSGDPVGDFAIPAAADGGVMLVDDKMTVRLTDAGDIAWAAAATSQNMAAIVDRAGELVVGTRDTPAKVVATRTDGQPAWWVESTQSQLTALAQLPDGTIVAAGDRAFEAFQPTGELDALSYADLDQDDIPMNALAPTSTGGLAFAGTGPFIGVLDAP